MKNLQKMIFRSLTLILVLTTAACSSGNNSESSPSSNTNATAVPAGDSAKSNEKYTISMMDMTYGKIPPSDGAAVQQINEKFNIDYKPTIVPYDGYLEKMSTTIAGGDMPDILGIEEYVAAGSLQKWADQGAFLKLNDYITKYPTLALIPPEIWAAVTNKDGTIWGIPRYYPNTPTQSWAIRQDWLDNLKLKVPTSYEELAAVALAFTNDDPDQNGKDDTYGLVMNPGGHPNYGMGAYWDIDTWYHKDADGNLIPGYIGEGRKESVALFADLYKQGAITKGFGANASIEVGQADFYNNKAGIYVAGIRGMDANLANSLLSVAPTAKLSAIPPFKAPDGTQGFTAQRGYYRITVLNGKLAGDEGKIDRILSLIDFGRTFVPIDEQNPDNEIFDFRSGKVGTGYTNENGVNTFTEPDLGLMPSTYLPDSVMWAPSVLDNKYADTQTNPLLKPIVKELEQQYVDYEQYVDPSYFGYSATLNSGKGSDAVNKVIDTQVKMMMGETPLSDWDNMVNKFLSSGGSDIINEMNESLKGKEMIGYKNMSK
ncbi:extracellular solute-binding protein [Paenibacillus sp. 19GGS1-52]|uniref:extracellular solute-binding protein n=1 Tax=Paenibacillus sp. 19GGS1-52 TaxID=2758563 RepID=UPI001EFB68C4|nr:extracellular solute-binding protein [Paenibacillus sp. 19GGS1-52]ULO06881.1 extracellular solute-binding protein [Paenibacillus sp. 19GGS1-52]